jgi:hypothetical protein
MINGIVKTIIQQGRREYGPRGVRFWYVEGNIRLRTKLVIVFTVPSVDGSTNHPMAVINHIDQQARQVHPGKLGRHLVFGVGGHQ